VAADVEHDAVPDDAGRAELRFHVAPRLPRDGPAAHVRVPCPERSLSVLVSSAVPQNCRNRDLEMTRIRRCSWYRHPPAILVRKPCEQSRPKVPQADSVLLTSLGRVSPHSAFSVKKNCKMQIDRGDQGQAGLGTRATLSQRLQRFGQVMAPWITVTPHARLLSQEALLRSSSPEEGRELDWLALSRARTESESAHSGRHSSENSCGPERSSAVSSALSGLSSPE
jgi:hypothetical protein